MPSLAPEWVSREDFSPPSRSLSTGAPRAPGRPSRPSVRRGRVLDAEEGGAGAEPIGRIAWSLGVAPDDALRRSGAIVERDRAVGQLGADGDHLLADPGQAEIGDLEDARLRDQEIARLDVAVAVAVPAAGRAPCRCKTGFRTAAPEAGRASACRSTRDRSPPRTSSIIT